MTRLGDIGDGLACFMEEKFGEEIRETYFVREGSEMVLVGCMQGNPALPDREDGGPRYRNICEHRNAYPLVPALPVKPCTESRWWWIASAICWLHAKTGEGA